MNEERILIGRLMWFGHHGKCVSECKLTAACFVLIYSGKSAVFVLFPCSLSWCFPFVTFMNVTLMDGNSGLYLFIDL